MDKGMSSPPPPPPGFVPAPPPPPPYSGPPQPNVVYVVPQFSSQSQRMTCPHCHTDINTRVENTANTRTHLFALLLCVFGLWCCAPIPYCVDNCMSQKHYCPSCNIYLGQSNPAA
ncbi:unnamed protein product [Xylocopa violacea]|uniref:LITAF domain-containing protein n=1 Tax=Xylocopa violacea TaxID=135666 RepID=A0ABP1N0B6_XYLVO